MMQQQNFRVIELIKENIEKQNPFLDLGDCGLDDYSPELELLEDCKHLKGINLGEYYYINDKPVYANNGKNKNLSNSFSKIPHHLPQNIEKIYINLVRLDDISNINLYTELTHFDAFGNKISSIPNLENNKKLISLGLSNNLISDAKGIEVLHNLTHLYLGQNQIERLSSDLFKSLQQLTHLYLYKNNLTDLDFLENNRSIKELYASDNKIKTVSNVNNLNYLEVLDVSYNPIITVLPQEHVLSKSAVKIRWQLHKEPLTLAAFLIKECIEKKEIFLDLGDCALNDKSQELSELTRCTQLKSLSLGTGYFTDANEYKQTPNNLTSNVFTFIPPNLPSGLIALQLRGCMLHSISNIDHLKKLELLDLSFNEIKAITGVSGLLSLTELALHTNKIIEIESVVFPPKLAVLYLDNNRLIELKGIEKCQNLESLFISSNNVFNIRPLTSLKKIKELRLENNPIVDCPSDVWLGNDFNQIKAYFNEVELKNKSNDSGAKSNINNEQDIQNGNASHGNTIPNDVKLIILGNSNTGKSNLVHYLQTGQFLNVRDSTHGLEVIRWKPDTNRFPQLKNVEVSIWDFGGQEYYHDAYKLFLGNDAVYIALWCGDSDCNDKKEELVHDNQDKVWIDHFEKMYWLDTLKYFRGTNNNSPLLLVQNKVDEPESQKKRIGQDLHDEYQINESFHISLLKGCDEKNTESFNNLQAFTQYLADVLSKVANGAQLPEDCKKVRNEVLKLSDDKESIFSQYLKKDLSYIQFKDFKKACEDSEKINSDNHNYYPIWLNRGGTLVYFENNEELKDTIFINPKVLSKKIYTILNDQVRVDLGDVAINNLEHENKIIIDSMKSLGLLYPHPTKSTTHFIAPQYLPEDHPIEDLFKIASVNAWKDSFWIKVPLFFYKKLMHFLLLHYISDQQVSARYFWKNGIIILKNEPQVKILIKGLYPTDKEGIIQISIEDCKELPDLQKEIMETILSFKIKTQYDSYSANTQNTESKHSKTITPNESSFQDPLFVNKLMLSVDKKKFELYNHLVEISNLKDDPEYTNKIIRYQHLLPSLTNIPKPKNIFISYSHKNAHWVGKLKNHLAGLRRSNFVKEWTDQELLAGEKWDTKIKEQMKKADIFILMLSADFIASDYIWNTELNEALTYNTTSNTTIIPVYVEPCDLLAIPNSDGNGIRSFEIIPKEKEFLKPLSLWQNEAEGLTKVAERIREVVMK